MAVERGHIFEPHECTWLLRPTWTNCSPHYHHALMTNDQHWAMTADRNPKLKYESVGAPVLPTVRFSGPSLRTTSGRCVSAAVQELRSAGQRVSSLLPRDGPSGHLCENPAAGQLQTAATASEMHVEKCSKQNHPIHNHLPCLRLPNCSTTPGFIYFGLQSLFLQNRLGKLSLSWPFETFKAFKY